MVELCNIVPNPSIKVYIPALPEHRLRLQDTGYLFWCDKEDWLKARTCLWWYDEARRQPVNAVGLLFTEYVGITGSRLTTETEKYNFCRYCYGL